MLRVLYDPPLELYGQYGFKLWTRGWMSRSSFARTGSPKSGGSRSFLNIGNIFWRWPALIRAAITETVSRGYTHYITDVFEDDPHSPYEFHTRVLGFAPVATHDVGELNCKSRRITLVLDIKQLTIG